MYMILNMLKHNSQQLHLNIQLKVSLCLLLSNSILMLRTHCLLRR
nr:MAG TPA: hypothetical protein [Caudoviricetes sp.]